jgi:hypothetical protein
LEQEAFMNRIVKEHYPASKLPEDLREGLAPGAEVTVTIEWESAPNDDIGEGGLSRRLRRPERVMTLEEMFAMRRPVYRSGAEIDAEIRRQRDEWDD